MTVTAISNNIKKSAQNGSLQISAVMGCLLVWMDLAFRLTVVPQLSLGVDILSLPRMDEAWLSFLTAFPVGLVLLAVFNKLAADRDRYNKALTIAGATMMSLGSTTTVLVIISVQTVAVGGFISGLGLAFFLSANLPVLFNLRISDLSPIAIQGCIISAVSSVLTLVLTHVALRIVVVLLPFVILVLSRTKYQVSTVANSGIDQSSENRRQRIDILSLVTILIALAGTSLCMGILGFYMNSLDNSELLLHRILVLAGGSLIGAVVLQISRCLGGRFALRLIVMGMLATTVLLMVFMNLSPVGLTTEILANATTVCSYFMLFVILNEYNRRIPVTMANLMVAATLAVISLLGFISVIAGGVIRSIFGLNQTVLSIAALVMLYLALLILLAFSRNKRTVEHVLVGSIVSDQELADIRGNIISEQFPSLTTREKDILRLLLLNYSNGRIAKTLVVSENTVKSHVKHVLAKVCVKNRQQLLEIAEGIRTADQDNEKGLPVQESPFSQ